MVSHLPHEWRFDAATSAFVSAGTVIRVVALRAGEAALLEDARQQVEALYCALFEAAKFPAASAKRAVASAFSEPTDPAEAARPARVVLVYYDATPGTPSDRVAAYARVLFDGERVIVSSIAAERDSSEDAQQQVLRATVLVTEELAMAIAREVLLQVQPSQPLMIWRAQLGASDQLKGLYEQEGYSSKLTERMEMTAWLKDLGGADAHVDTSDVEDVEIRALDLANDDLEAVYDVLQDAFGPKPPCFEAWTRHYAQHPRFAPELSFVAWQGDKPIAVACVELVVEGEGGGDDEVMKVFNTHAALLEAGKTESSTKRALTFADDYEQRKNKIRASTKVGHVCSIATLPVFRGQRLGPALLRHTFRAAARQGLDAIVLGTDRHNPAAVRAYVRAGMVETKAVDLGYVTAKLADQPIP